MKQLEPLKYPCYSRVYGALLLRKGGRAGWGG